MRAIVSVILLILIDLESAFFDDIALSLHEITHIEIGVIAYIGFAYAHGFIVDQIGIVSSFDFISKRIVVFIGYVIDK